jgi:hypothetical protein
MRVIWFCFFLVFLQPVHSSQAVEECKSWAGEYKRVAELRDKGLNPFQAIEHMVLHWDKIEDSEKKDVLDKIVIVWHKYKDLTPDSLYKKALEACYKSHGILNV